MKFWMLILLAPILASCNARSGGGPLQTSSQDIVGRPIALAPSKAALSSPSVVTTKGIIAYEADLEACRRLADKRLGTDGKTDDVAAILRTVGDKPVEGHVSVKYESSDFAIKRDTLVRVCLSDRGYVVKR